MFKLTKYLVTSTRNLVTATRIVFVPHFIKYLVSTTTLFFPCTFSFSLIHAFYAFIRALSSFLNYFAFIIISSSTAR